MDIHTLHVEHVVLLCLYTLLTLINAGLHRGTPGINWFPVYNLSALMGAVLIALRGQIPEAVSAVAGNWFVIFAYLTLYFCLAEFFGTKVIPLWTQITLCVGSFLVMLYWGGVHPNTASRLLALSLMLGAEQGLTAMYVYRNSFGSIRTAGRLMALMLALLSSINLTRVVGVLIQGAPQNYLTAGTFLAWIVLMNSTLQGGVVVAFVWMTAASLRRELEVLASTDSLTGLLNRRAMELAAETHIARSRQGEKPLSAILIDLDGFKRINDSLGHQSGDMTLIAVARCLQGGLRKGDLLARLGGDEFAVLLPETGMADAVDMAERLRTALELLEIECGSTRTTVSASFGLAQIHNGTPDWDQLILHCDKALYAVKNAGGNLVLAN